LSKSAIKVLKKRSPLTPRPSQNDSFVEVMREQLAAANKREQELLRQLSELQAQIRMVLEERFFKPISASSAKLPDNKFNMELHEDVVHFPSAGDEKAIEKQAEAEKKARETLDAELASISEEHRKWHETHPLNAEAIEAAVEAEEKVPA
jgi:hypothetical protein